MVSPQSPHTFHIPVMGLAFTLDSPIKVARYGISSVISIMEDNLIEKMRKHYTESIGESYVAITSKEPNYRSLRITAYLNLVHLIVQKQIQELKSQAFEEGSDLYKYFEMLPNENVDKQLFDELATIVDLSEKEPIENYLKGRVIAGRIDVNIMTKLDRVNKDAKGNEIVDGSDAVTAMSGYVNSTLSNSMVVLSAGMNPRLFAYMEGLPAFQIKPEGHFSKMICVKVSDYRSALVQGKMLAKKGLWVSEFRIESGLNCGGHAFATDGHLLGPILEEFKTNRTALVTELFAIYQKSNIDSGKTCAAYPPQLRITVQGGIGNSDEDAFLRKHYNVDSTGWGSPFLLVPEATTVDFPTLSLLTKAKEKDVYLSKNSPLGVRFYYLRGTSADQEKHRRIREGKPGSPCTEKYLSSNTEFTAEPICTASSVYQKKKIAQLKALKLNPRTYQKQLDEVLSKECLCIGLSNAAVHTHNLEPFKKLDSVNICPGPNIVYFNRPRTLKQMVDIIYGRLNIDQSKRPHMFIKELNLYVDYWLEMAKEMELQYEAKKANIIKRFHDNLMKGIQYYKDLYGSLDIELQPSMNNMQLNLHLMEVRLEKLLANYYVETVSVTE